MLLKQRAYATGKAGVITAAYLLTLHDFYDQPYPHSSLIRERMLRLTAQLWTQAQYLTPLSDEEYVHSFAVRTMAMLLELSSDDRAQRYAGILCTAAANIGLIVDLDHTQVAANLLGLAMYNNFRLTRDCTPPQPASLFRTLTSREQMYFEFLHHRGYEDDYGTVDFDTRELWEDLHERLQCCLKVTPLPSQLEIAVVEKYRTMLSTVTDEHEWMTTSLETISGSLVPYNPTYTVWTAYSCLEALITRRFQIVG